MKPLFRLIDSIAERLGPVIRYLVLIPMLLISWETFSRYLFNSPTIWAHGISELVMACYYVLGGAYILRIRGHANMDIVYSRFTPRIKAVVELCTAVFFFSFCGVLLWKGAEMAWKSAMILETTEGTFRVPLYPIKLLVPVTALLMLIQGLAQFVRNIVTAVTGRSYEY